MEEAIPSEFPEGIFVENGNADQPDSPPAEQEKLLETDDIHMSSFLDDWEPEADQDGRMVAMDSGDDRSVDSLPMSPDEANSNQNADIQGRTGMAPTLVGEETSHAFFCFAWEDDEWSINVIRKLESTAYGFTCDNSNHKWDPGVARMDKIINAMSTSKKLVLVLSPDFMHSPWCTYENLRALRTHYTNMSKVVLVVLNDMDVPDFLEGIPTISAQSRNFWQRFVAALRLGSSLDAHDASLNNNVPALYNGAQLATVQSLTQCCCRARFDTIYCPDDLARRGVQIPQHDYTSAISTIIEAPKMRWYTLWYNRLFSSTICAVITALIIVGVVGNLSSFNKKGKLHVGVALVIAIVLSAVVVGLLHLIVFYEKRKLNGLIEANLSRANMVFSKHNILSGMTDKFAWCWNTAVLHFVYFDLTECRKEMIRFLRENRTTGETESGINRNSTVSIDMSTGEAEDTTRLTVDTRLRTLSPETLVADTDPRSLAEEAELYLMQNSAAYINKLLKKQLVGPLRKRHCRTTLCLCQFAQKTVFHVSV